MGFPSLASEFPNDNAEISDGAIWIGAELTGPARLEPPPYRPAAPEAFILVFEGQERENERPMDVAMRPGAATVTVRLPETVHRSEVESVQPVDEIAVAPAFARFEAALAAALMAHGASRSAALLPRVLRLESLPADTLSKEVLLTLQSRGYLDGSTRYSQKFRDLCTAWSAVLRGSSQDFAACGTTTLDRFGADLLAALLAVPATRADELRRQLRKAGIAAFGVLDAA